MRFNITYYYRCNDDTLDNDNVNYYFSSAFMLKVFQSLVLELIFNLVFGVQIKFKRIPYHIITNIRSIRLNINVNLYI